MQAEVRYLQEEAVETYNALLWTRAQWAVNLTRLDARFSVASRLVKGLPALVRTAARDQAGRCHHAGRLLRHLQTQHAFREAVPPWFGRRMARHLEEEGANVTFQASEAI